MCWEHLFSDIVKVAYKINITKICILLGRQPFYLADKNATSYTSL
jgi:hypothetical protein